MQNEHWRPIDGHPGYEVSDLGRVRSVDRVIEQMNRWGQTIQRRLRGQIIKQFISNSGYHSAVLGREGGSQFVHRLVAAAFVPGDQSLTVNHDDGDRSNNTPGNLEWMTQGENNQHSYDFLPRKQHAKTTAVRVGHQTYPSMSSAAEAVGVSVGSVASAVHRGHLCKGMEVARG